MGITRKVRREMQMQARKAFRSAIKEEAVLMEYQKRFRDGYDKGFEDGVKAAYGRIEGSKNSGVVGVVSEKQFVDMLKEGV